MILDLSLDNRIVLMQPLDCAIQELNILFHTANTELIGNPEYGTNFEDFLWTLTPTTEALEEYITEKLQNTFFVSRLNPTVEVTTEPGIERDIYYVNINLEINSNNPDDQRKAHRVFMLS